MTPLPHLDRLFDYEVPANLSAVAVPGARVRVRLAGRLVDGFILERSERSQHDMQPLSSVHGPAVLTPAVATLCRAIADRYAGTLADVVRFAVPPRHARAEASATPFEPPAVDSPSGPGGWAAYHRGPELVEGLGGPTPTRALWISAPGERPWARISELVRRAAARGRGVLVIAPDRSDVDGICEQLGGDGVRATRLLADAGPQARYSAFLRVLSGGSRVVIGTRTAVFAPVADLGAIIVWGDGEDSLAEPQAPGWHAREVAALRSSLVGADLVIGAPSVSLEAARMVAAGWLTPVEVPKSQLRIVMPRVQASADLAADPARAASRIPSVALDALREAVCRGPVLVSVPRAGYLPMVSCQQCREPVTCPRCHRPAHATGPDRRPTCHTHDVIEQWRCSLCGGTRVRAVIVGVRRTAEEFGRALPGVQVVMSSADDPSRDVPGDRVVVVATPGAEPDPGRPGYAGLVLLDAAAALSRPGLRVAEEVLRRWFAAACLVRSGADGGRVVLVGESQGREVQALIRWDPLGYATRELAERAELHLPPAVRTARLTGQPAAVEQFVEEVAAELGEALLRRSGPLPAPEGAVTWLVAVAIGEGARLSSALQQGQSRRSARREPVISVRLDPVSLR